VKAYKILCLALNLVPSIGVFFSFYHIKSFTVDRLVSLCTLPNQTLFSLYANNFKNYQDSFFRVRGGPNCQDVMYDSDGTPLFPFNWSANPRLVKGADTAHLSSFEMETVAFFNSFDLLSTKKLVNLETNPKGVVEFLSKCYSTIFIRLFLCRFEGFSLTLRFTFAGTMKTIFYAEFASYLVKARQKIEMLDNTVDPISQVVVAGKAGGKGVKRGRRGEAAPTSNKAAKLGDDVETAGEDDGGDP
jgi:hypothetical protein